MMTKNNREETWLSDVINYLELIKAMYEQGVVPTMIDDSNNDDRVKDIEELIIYLQQTNDD